MSKKTYGQQLIEHESKGLDFEDDIREYRRAQEPDIVKILNNVAYESTKHELYHNRDFYIVHMISFERVGGVPRHRIFARRSCPTPVYRQNVWKYHHQSQTLEFLWTIPDQIRYYHLWHNKSQFLQDKEWEQMTKYVVLMETGELLNWVKKENGELKDAVIFNRPDLVPGLLQS